MKVLDDSESSFVVRAPLSHQEIADGVSRSYHMQAKWHLSLMEMIAEADRSEIYLSEGLSSTADWLARFLGIGYMSALKLTEVAVALQGLPKLAEAYRCGRVSYDHLRALVQVADEENEQALLAEVEGTSVADTYRLVRRILEVSAEDARLNRQDRCLEMRWDHETRNLYLFGRLPEDQGAKVERAIDAIARRMPEDPAFDPGPRQLEPSGRTHFALLPTPSSHRTPRCPRWWSTWRPRPFPPARELVRSRTVPRFVWRR